MRRSIGRVMTSFYIVFPGGLWYKFFMSRYQFIADLPLFNHLSQKQLEILSEVGKVRFYKKGEVIFGGAEFKSGFYYIIQGWIKLFKTSVDGTEIIMEILTNHSYFGEEIIFDPLDEPYVAQAISSLQLFIVPIDALRRLIDQDHAFSIHLLKNTLQKQRRLKHEIEYLSVQNAMQRIGCFVLRLSHLEKTPHITLPYDKMLLASRLGMRPETFSRSLTKLRNQCNIQIKDDILTISSKEKITQSICRQCSRTFPCKNRI